MRLQEVDLMVEGLAPDAWRDEPLATATLHGAGRSHHVAVLATRSMTLANVLPIAERPLGLPLLVVGPAINERTADAFRRARINYVDESGNAHIRLDGILVDVRGRKGVRRAAQARMANSATGALGKLNLFSAKRAQVIFALLAWPELHEAPLRVIAHVAGVSLGQVSETHSLLEDLGYLDKRTSIGFVRRQELLEGWLFSYPAGLGRSTQLRDFEGDLGEISYIDPRGVVSGEYAVPDLLRGTSMTLYVSELQPRMIVANRWRPGPRPNIHIRRKFWEEIEIRSNISYPQVAPPLLVYADLLMSGEGRQVEVAREYREIHDL